MTQIFAFSYMPYLEIEDDFEAKYESSWVTYPNKNYDPKKGHVWFNEHIEQLIYADKMGFDGVVVNEHHANSYGVDPAPNLVAAMLAQRTKGKIAILGNCIPLHAMPQRIAEELAMLDVFTGGNRIICGLVRGGGAEYFTANNVNPIDSKQRFYEAHDIIVKAWTEPGPFEFHGKYYDFNYINIWPRPISDIPIFLPSTASMDTVEFAAKHNYTYMCTLSDTAAIGKVFDAYREKSERCGFKPTPEKLGFSHKIYVAETDAKAWEEFEDHYRFFMKYHFNITGYQMFPPGYQSAETRRMKMKAFNNEIALEMTNQELFDKGYVTVGSPETVKQRLTELQKQMGFGIINAHMHVGNMPHWKAMKNIELFSKYVLKDIQKLGREDEQTEKDQLFAAAKK